MDEPRNPAPDADAERTRILDEFEWGLNEKPAPRPVDRVATGEEPGDGTFIEGQFDSL